LSVTANKMEISSNNPELGDATEEIEVEYSGKELKVGFNSKYVSDVLSSIDNDFIDFEINDHLSPGVLRPAGDKNYTCVVMPMKI
jgi:DNA polymerase-3 subunit beta